MKKRKNKAQQAVAAVVMGMNLVNTMSPLALAAQAPVQPEAVRPAPQAQPLEYTVLPQVLQAVEGMVFARAEAAPQNITVNDGDSISADSFTDRYDSMAINSGGTGTIGIMNGGSQYINSGGVGSVGIMNNGGQGISSGGTGIIDTMNSGVQNVGSGGVTGIIGTVSNGSQFVDGSGYGSIGILNGSNGLQEIYSSGVGVIGTMNDGVQYAYRGGTCIIGTMEGGAQRGSLVYIETINNGSQGIYPSGVGSAGTMNDGTQTVSKGGTGNIGIMNGGYQEVKSVATGSIGIMNDGSQVVSSAATGSIETMNGGGQSVSGGIGSVGILNSGYQAVYSSGVGVIGTIDDGVQEVHSNATGSIGIMNSWGTQHIFSSGVGSIETMNSGWQNITHGGIGSIGTMNDGLQTFYGSGEASISTMNGGTQLLLKDSGSIGTMNGGMQSLSSATGSIGVMNGGEQQIGFSGVGIISSLNGGEQIVSGGTATETTINGGTQIIIGGVVSGNTVNAGVMLFEGSGAKVNDVTMNGGEMLFGSAAAYSISALNFNGGTVDLTENASADYQTLTLENYSGSGGTFKLDADFATGSADSVEITSANNAAGYIQVNGANIDESTVSEDNPLLLVTVSNGSATFTGKSLNGGGLYEYNPEIAEGNEIGGTPNSYYLTGLTKNVNNDTLALLDGIDNSYAMWRNTNDTLRKRLGEIHTLPSNDGADGVWARYIGGKFDGGSYEGQYNLYQLGYDKNYDAKSIIGFALEKGGGNATYSFGSGEDDLFAGAVYGSWLADDGSYTDVVAKIGRFDTELNSYGDFPDSADYRHNAYSLSVEYGKKISLNKAGLYLEPQAQFIAGRLDSVNYTTDRGTKVSVDGINSYIGRVGVMFGQQLENGSDVYIKANLLHEFGGESSLAMLAANGDALTMEKDYGDTWYELGIGANIKIGRASYFYGDIERGFGGDIDKKWQINAGLRFEF